MTPVHNENSKTTTMTGSIVPSKNLNLSGKEFEINLDDYYGSDIKLGSTKNDDDMILSKTNDEKSCNTSDEISLTSKKSVTSEKNDEKLVGKDPCPEENISLSSGSSSSSSTETLEHKEATENPGENISCEEESYSDTSEKNDKKVAKKDPSPEENISLSSGSSSSSSTETLENKEATENPGEYVSCEEESYSDDSYSYYNSENSNSSMESTYYSSNLSSYATDDISSASGYSSYSSVTTMSRSIGGKQAMKIPNNLLPRKKKNYAPTVPSRLPPPKKVTSKNKNYHDADCSSHVEKCATVAVSAALSVIENGGNKDMAEEVAFAVLSSLIKKNINHSPEEQKALGFLPAIAAECSTAILVAGGSRELAISAIVLALKHIENDDENNEQSRSENKKIECSKPNSAQNELGYTKENRRPTKNNQTSPVVPDRNGICKNNTSVSLPPKTTNVVKKTPRRKTDELMTIKENIILVDDKNKKKMIPRRRVTENDFEAPTDSRADLDTQITTPIVTSPIGNSHERESFGSKNMSKYDDSTRSKSEKKKKRKSKNSKSKYRSYDEIAERIKLATFDAKNNHQSCENCLSITSPIASKVGNIVADARVSFSRSLFQALKESGGNRRGGYDDGMCDNEILTNLSRHHEKS